MGEYEQTMTMQAAAGTILEFVSDIRNMPRYLPTTQHAEPQGEERVRVQGEAMGHKYDSDGYLRRDDAVMRLEWGSDEGHYSGWLQVAEKDKGASGVTIHISLHAKPGAAGGPDDGQINEGILAGLRSIRNQVEGRGGKEEPSAAT